MSDALPHRREALRLLAAGTTAALAGCGKPHEEIVPYVRMPERLVPGEPLRYATALPLSGDWRGVLVTAVDGRPIKVDGNPRHPASGGATDVFAEADILSLYDPDRSRTVLHRGEIASREAYRAALASERMRLDATGGAGLRVLTGRVTSPTLQRQLDGLLRRYPGARWHVHEPTADDRAREGARLAFGRPLVSLPRLDEARVLVTLGADPLGPGPDSMRLARGFATGRRPGPGMTRVYAFEPCPTLTGAKADHRVALRPDDLAEAAIALANGLGAGLRAPRLPDAAARVLDVAGRDLAAAPGSVGVGSVGVGSAGVPGRALVLAGALLPPPVHALVAWINARIGAPLDLLEPSDRVGGREPGTLAALCAELDGGGVDLLLVLGTNPAYDAPGDLAASDRMRRARLLVHAGTERDETARLAAWHLPLSHPLESWSDGRAVDSTAAIVQPLIRPLYDTTTPAEIVAEWAGAPEMSAHEAVRETWRSAAPAGEFDPWWRRVLHEGIVQGSRASAVPNLLPRLPAAADLAPTDATEPSPDRLDIVLAPDPCLWDGRYANNAWLQELPKPLTKEVWGNALGLGPKDAERLGIGAGDLATVTAGGRSVDVPVRVEPGHAAGCGSLALGGGRGAVGAIGHDVGTSAYPVRGSEDPWIVRAATVRSTGRRRSVPTTAHIVRDPENAAESLPTLTAAALRDGTAPSLATGPLATLLPPKPRAVDASAHAWGMVIDTAACVGCNACLVACQSENNVPVVGPEEIARGRTMHWLRVDVYDRGTADAPKPGFQPVPCMHCETAPCEPVCPVAASVHDSEGLNVQVYNRCVGTRFCEANCPYKVRRFNFYGYADGQEYADLGLESYRAGRNPDVTVRARGVMEKCTYCVQRISRARRTAEREDRPMRTDEVETACQGACPTRAITFGDLKDPGAGVSGLKADPRHYALLGHLGTRPRTTYLADLANASPDLPGSPT